MGVLKYILSFVIAIVFISNGLSQTAFFRTYSSGDFDMGEGICQLPDSSYLITGASGGVKYGSSQLFILKVSSKGEKIWMQHKGGSESETGRRIFYINNQIYVLGRTNSFGNSMDIYFLKLDSLGNTITEKAIGTPNYDWLEEAVFTPKDSTFLLYGYEQANDEFKKWRILQKIDLAGNVIWKQKVEINLDARIRKMRIYGDTLLALTGNEFNSTRQHFDGFVRFYDYNGNKLDSLIHFEKENQDFCFNEVMYSYSSKDRFFLTATQEYLQNDSSLMVPIMYRYFPSDKSILALSEGEEGSIYSYEYLANMPNSPADYLMISRGKKANFGIIQDGHWDEVYQRYLGTHNIYWENKVAYVSAKGDDITNQIIQTLDSGLIIVGYNEGFHNLVRSVSLFKIGPNFEVDENLPPLDESLVKINDETSSVIKIYPNPVENTLKIDTDIPLIHLQIISLTGKLILTSNSKYIDVSHLQSGSYLLKISTQDNIYTSTFIKR